MAVSLACPQILHSSFRKGLSPWSLHSPVLLHPFPLP